jgi:hypothetical protein
MKKTFILFNLLVLVILISSCGDILNPEPDTHTTPIKYHYVLKEQEHSVIMPLKVGNMWVYKVTELNGDGSVNKISYDTLLVKKDTIRNHEKWFIIDNSSVTYELGFLLFTNTDVGLFSNEDCSCNILKAEYPNIYKRYLYLHLDFPITDRDSLGEPYNQYINTDVWTDVERLVDYSTYLGIFDCFKYKTWSESKKKGKIILAFDRVTIEYYVPNLGLVYKELCKRNDDESLNIYETWELIYTNVKI